jgi:hypothetical protein
LNKIKEYHVLSWGGGTQSTALMIYMLENNMPLDYIIFADTKNEHALTYKQIYKVIKYVKEKYNKEIIVTSKNKKTKSDVEITKMIEKGLNYRSSEYADLFQSHILFFKGVLNSIDVMPLWVRDNDGKVGKTPFKACTFAFKLNQLMKELRNKLNIHSFSKNKHLIHMYIGYSFDEIARFKPNPKSYAVNHAPLIDKNITKSQCIDYVEEKLGFTPRSSVCNMCFANDFDRVYDIYLHDKDGWKDILRLDDAMCNKPKNHSLEQDVFMYRWQALENVRLKYIDMNQYKEKYDKLKETGQMSLFDEEQEWGCNGGCFL